MNLVWLLAIFIMPGMVMAVEDFDSLNDSGMAVQIRDRFTQDAFEGADENFTAINLRPYHAYQAEKNSLYFIKGNLYASNIVGGDNEVISSRKVSRNYLEVSEYWWQHTLADDSRRHSRLGMQKFDDVSGLWWDAPLTGASYVFDSSLLNAYVGVGDRSSYLRTDWDVDHPVSSSALYLISQISWQWQLDHFFIARAAYRHDRDNNYVPGVVYSTAEVAVEQIDALWLDAEVRGEWRYREDRYVRYEAELAWSQGSRVRYATKTLSEDALLINSRDESDLQGYLLRSGIDYVWQFDQRWLLGLDALYASGGNGVDGGFGQTGLNTNRNALYTTNLHGSLTGESMRIAISNVQILGVHGSFSYQNRHEAIIALRYAARASADDEISLNGRLPANRSKDIGSSIDLAYGWYLPAAKQTRRLQLGEFEGMQLMVYFSHFLPAFDDPGKNISGNVVGGKFIWAF